jgi:hypothetical protein
LICNEHFTLTSDGNCQQNCIEGTTFFDPKENKCVACKACKNCYEKGDTICSFCDICNRDCDLKFSQISNSQFILSSKEVIFPETQKLKYSIIKETLDKQKIKIESSYNQVVFDFSQMSSNYDPITIALHKENLITKQCKLFRDIPLFFPPTLKKPMMSSNLSNIINKTHSISQEVYKQGLIFSSVFSSTSSNFSSLILLLMVNNLYGYSFIQRPSVMGLTSIVHDLNRFENKNFDNYFPLTKISGTYFSLKTGEVTIQMLPLLSLTLFLSLLIILFYVLFMFSYLNIKEQQIKELAPAFMKKRMDREFMKKFFKVYSKKLSYEKMVQINDYFKEMKKRIQSSKPKKMFRRFFRKLNKNKNRILFSFLQISAVQLAHLTAKSTKMLIMIGPLVPLVLLTFLYFFVLTCLCSISLFTLESHQMLYEKYLEERDVKSLEEYHFIMLNLPYVIFIILYTYFQVFYGTQASEETSFIVSFFILMACYSAECYLNKKLLNYCFTRVIISFPVILIHIVNMVQSEELFSVISDVMLVYINLSTLSLIVYDLYFKPISSYVEDLIENHRK